MYGQCVVWWRRECNTAREYFRSVDELSRRRVKWQPAKSRRLTYMTEHATLHSIGAWWSDTQQIPGGGEGAVVVGCIAHNLGGVKGDPEEAQLIPGVGEGGVVVGDQADTWERGGRRQWAD